MTDPREAALVIADMLHSIPGAWEELQRLNLCKISLSQMRVGRDRSLTERLYPVGLAGEPRAVLGGEGSPATRYPPDPPAVDAVLRAEGWVVTWTYAKRRREEVIGPDIGAARARMAELLYGSIPSWIVVV